MRTRLRNKTIMKKDYRNRSVFGERMWLKSYHPPCSVCDSSGNIYFTYEGKHYPNTPCPACRYQKLLEWCDHWGVRRSVARWLKNHYLDESNRFIRGTGRLHRRVPLIWKWKTRHLVREPQLAGSGMPQEEPSGGNPHLSGSAPSGLVTGAEPRSAAGEPMLHPE